MEITIKNVETRNRINVEIGTMIEFDEFRFNQLSSTYEAVIIPRIENIAREYELLGLGQFTTEVYQSIMDSGINQIEKKLMEQVQLEVKKAKIPLLAKTMLDQVPGQLLPLGKAISAFNESSRGGWMYPGNWQLTSDEFSIVDGKPVLHKQNMINRFATYIETETEREGWKLMLEVQAASEKFADFLRSKNYPVNRSQIYSQTTGEGFFCEDWDTGSLRLNTDQLKILYRYESGAA